MPTLSLAAGAAAGWLWGPQLLDRLGVAQDMSRQNQQVVAAAALAVVAYMVGDRLY